MSAAGPPPPSAGGGAGSFLTRRVFGMPLWLVGGIVIIGGVALALYIRGRNQTPSGQALGQSGSTGIGDPNIDPNTGVPYSVEDAIDPNTGLPAYFDLFPPPTTTSSPPPAPPPGPTSQPPPSPGNPPPTPNTPPPGTPPGPLHNPPPPGVYPPPGSKYGIGHWPPDTDRHHLPGNLPPPSPGARTPPPPIHYGGTQATAYWPIPLDVLDLRGGVFPTGPELGYGGSGSSSGEAA